MTNLESLPTFGPAGTVNVVVEACRGMRAKCKFDSQFGVFVFDRPLPHGLVYPFDWGFIPSTRGEDGDPLDAMVLHDAPCPVGCLIRCQPLAVLRISQREKGRIKRNDRLVFRPAADPAMKEQTILTARVKRELEQFFAAAVLGTGKRLTFQGWRNADKALRAVHQGVTPD